MARVQQPLRNDQRLFIDFSLQIRFIFYLSRLWAQPWLKLQGFSILPFFPTFVHFKTLFQPSPTLQLFADTQSTAPSPPLTVPEWQPPAPFHGVAKSIRWRTLLLFRNGCRSLAYLTRRCRFREWMLEREGLWLWRMLGKGRSYCLCRLLSLSLQNRLVFFIGSS